MSFLELLGPDTQDALLARANQLVKKSSNGWKDAGRELLHDAYIKALENQGKFRGSVTEQSIGGFVYGVIGNLHMNRNTVEFGRNGRRGRRGLLKDHIRQQCHLYRPGGKRARVVNPKQFWSFSTS